MRTVIYIAGLVLSMAMATTCALGEVKEPPPRLPVERWLLEPEQRLPGWTVRVEGPVLTFALRQAVTLRAEADVQDSKLLGHDLHFFVRVADAQGHWLPEKRYSSIEKLPRMAKVTATERFFADPGDYRISFVIYDSVNGTHGVWHRPVHVPKSEKVLSYPYARSIEYIDPEEPFKLSDSPALPPLENRNAVRVDVVLNLTERSELELGDRHDIVLDQFTRGGRRYQHVYPNWQLGRERQDFTTESLLAIAEVLDEMKLNGCVQVSVVDAVRSKVMVDRRRLLDPAAILKALKERRDTQKVDARVLLARQQAGTFLHNFLQGLIADNSGCNTPSERMDRAIVLISDALVFPESKQLTPLRPPPAEVRATRFYFLRMTVTDYVGGVAFGRAYTSAAIPPDDQVGRLLKDLDVHRFNLSEPKDFERALPKFLDDLKVFGSSN